MACAEEKGGEEGEESGPVWSRNGDGVAHVTGRWEGDLIDVACQWRWGHGLGKCMVPRRRWTLLSVGDTCIYLCMICDTRASIRAILLLACQIIAHDALPRAPIVCQSTPLLNHTQP